MSASIKLNNEAALIQVKFYASIPLSLQCRSAHRGDRLVVSTAHGRDRHVHAVGDCRVLNRPSDPSRQSRRNDDAASGRGWRQGGNERPLVVQAEATVEMCLHHDRSNNYDASRHTAQHEANYAETLAVRHGCTSVE
jgi:hypothetical protein